MAAEKRHFFTHERRVNGDRRHSDRRGGSAAQLDLYRRIEDLRVAIASDRRRFQRRRSDHSH
jgi:hypothetical protein